MLRRLNQVDILIAGISILIPDQKPNSEPIEKYFVEVFRFYLPDTDKNVYDSLGKCRIRILFSLICVNFI